MNNTRVYVEKKKLFNEEGKKLLKEFREYLGIKN